MRSALGWPSAKRGKYTLTQLAGTLQLDLGLFLLYVDIGTRRPDAGAFLVRIHVDVGRMDLDTGSIAG